MLKEKPIKIHWMGILRCQGKKSMGIKIDEYKWFDIKNREKCWKKRNEHARDMRNNVKRSNISLLEILRGEENTRQINNWENNGLKLFKIDVIC